MPLFNRKKAKTEFLETFPCPYCKTNVPPKWNTCEFCGSDLIQHKINILCKEFISQYERFEPEYTTIMQIIDYLSIQRNMRDSEMDNLEQLENRKQFKRSHLAISLDAESRTGIKPIIIKN